mgnify:CR=1 FL=1
MKEKTLIIFMGSARGGKHAMLTQEKYLIDHLDADLALCLGDVDEIDDFLIEKGPLIETLSIISQSSSIKIGPFSQFKVAFFNLAFGCI